MLSKIMPKRNDLKKTVKSAVKEEVKTQVKAALAQDFLNSSAEIVTNNDKIDSDLYKKYNVKLIKKFLDKQKNI